MQSYSFRYDASVELVLAGPATQVLVLNQRAIQLTDEEEGEDVDIESATLIDGNTHARMFLLYHRLRV